MSSQQPYSGDLRDLFLSHRSVNKTIVRDLAGDIEAESFQGRGLLTWLDEAEIRPGQSIPAMVNAGLESSRFIGLVMTPDYFDPATTGWTDAEWPAALHQDPDNRRARIIPYWCRIVRTSRCCFGIWQPSTCGLIVMNAGSKSFSPSYGTSRCLVPSRIAGN